MQERPQYQGPIIIKDLAINSIIVLEFPSHVSHQRILLEMKEFG